jgi:hypothetical protein
VAIPAWGAVQDGAEPRSDRSRSRCRAPSRPRSPPRPRPTHGGRYQGWPCIDATGCSFFNVKFNRIDMTNVSVTGCSFSQSSFANIDFTTVTMGNNSFGRLDISNSNLSNKDLSYDTFDGMVADSLNLTSTNFSNITFQNEVTVHNSNLTSANFSSISCSPSTCNPYDFSGSNVTGTNFTGANLSGATLSGATGSNTNFTKAPSPRRPPRLPRARAAARPAIVRSRMRSRSNSANAPKTWKTSLPPLVLVSSGSCKLRKCTPRSCSSLTVSMRWARATKPVEPPHNERVSRADIDERLGEAWTVSTAARGGVSADFVAPGGSESVPLQRGCLIGGGDYRRMRLHSRGAGAQRNRRSRSPSLAFGLRALATIDNRCIRQPYSSVLLVIEMCGGAPWASLFSI